MGAEDLTGESRPRCDIRLTGAAHRTALGGLGPLDFIGKQHSRDRLQRNHATRDESQRQMAPKHHFADGPPIAQDHIHSSAHWRRRLW